MSHEDLQHFVHIYPMAHNSKITANADVPRFLTTTDIFHLQRAHFHWSEGRGGDIQA
jgi:hypothetical protein